ncbi:hypothetical protein AZ012_004702 [Citrobacter amalonaticus]|nr:hypothetical protein AZ012_004702 [Citrobacter amalonaticus]
MSRLRVRSVFRYSERTMKYIKDSTRRQLESIGVDLDKLAQLKQWHAGNYYGSIGNGAEVKVRGH